MYKLSRHIALRMTFILVSVAVLIGGAVLYNNTRRLERVFKDQLIIAGKMYTDVLDQSFNEMAQTFNKLRTTLESENLSETEYATRDAKSILEGSWSINNVFYVSNSTKGRTQHFYMTKGLDGSINTTQLENDDIIKESCHEVDDLVNLNPSEGYWVNVCSESYLTRVYIEPLMQGSSHLGYIGTIVEINNLDLPEFAFLGSTTEILLLDHDGHILSSTSNIKYKSIKEFLVPNEQLRTAEDIQEFRDLTSIDFLRGRISGQYLFMAVNKFEDNFFLAVMVSESSLRFQLTQSYLIYALAILAFFMVVLLVSFWLMDRVMKPFNGLISFANLIGDGEYSSRMPDSYLGIKHEMGEIARAFEAMRQNLEQAFLTLEEERDQHLLTQSELSVMTEVLENSNEGVFILNADRKIIYSNSAYSKLSGYSTDELEGKPVSIFDVEGKDFRAEVLELLSEQGVWTGEVTQLRKNTLPYPASLIVRLLRDYDDNPMYYFVITEDLTDKHKNDLDHITLRNKDSKTGLPNSNQMRNDINDMIDMGTKFALIYIGIDDFKSINEIYGFNAGDAVIVSLSEKLPLVSNESDKLYRIGGDEFAFIINLEDLLDDLDKFIQQVQSIIRHPIRRNNTTIYMTASMGISSYPRDDNSAEGVITSALSALNKAKQDARGFHYYFSKELREQSERRQMILSQLYEAVDRDEFYLVYQPKIDVTKDALVGMEALLRWDNKVLGNVSPAEFVPVAEDSAIIEKIGRWVIQQAIEDLRAIHDLGHDELSVSVNLSGQQFKDESLFAWILENLSELELAPDHFELEITESLLLDNLHEAVPQLNMLKRAGVIISIDDFGTGYSSLSYLQHLPIDVLKIDRSFLKGVEIDSPGTIINAIIELGKALNLHVVAEGIETEAQKHFLMTRGCVIHQGYFYNKPGDIKTIIEQYNLED